MLRKRILKFIIFSPIIVIGLFLLSALAVRYYSLVIRERCVQEAKTKAWDETKSQSPTESPYYIFVSSLIYSNYEDCLENNKISVNQMADIKALGQFESPPILLLEPQEWIEYKSGKWGYSFKFPQLNYFLNLEEVDIVAKNAWYKYQCEIRSGCGGGGAADYIAKFNEMKDGTTVFEVYIWNYDLGRIEANSEDFNIGEQKAYRTENKDNKEHIKSISYQLSYKGKTIEFVGRVSDLYSPQQLDMIAKTINLFY